MAKTQWSSNFLFVALILPVAKPTTKTRSPCAMNSGGSGYEVSTVSLAFCKQIRQSRVPAVRAGQRPVLARNDPLNIFGRQRQQTLLIAAAECCKKILHNLDILLCAHRNLSISLTSDRVRSFYSKLTLSCLSLLERNSRKSISFSGPVSARQLSHRRYFFDFSHDLICPLLTRPGPCPHRRRDPRR